MPETDALWMSAVIFIPSIFALGLVFFPRGYEEGMRWWSLFGTALTLGASLFMFISFYKDTIETPGVLTNAANREKAGLLWRADQADVAAARGDPAKSKDWVARYPWIERFHIDYFLGTDGISMALILLSTVLFFLSMIASWKIDKFVRGYCMLFLILETGVLGTFLALDFFLFYIFWEVMLLPMYFLIGIWGGPRREYAAIKFFLYTLFGSVFILIALLAFYFTNVRDFTNSEQVEAEVERLRVSGYDKIRDEWKKARGDAAEVEQSWTEARDALNAADAELGKAEAELQKAKPADKDKAQKKVGEAKDAKKNAQEAFDKEEAKKLSAEIKRDKAHLARENFLAKAPVTVNTFDLVVLQRVGKAALRKLNNEEVDKESVPALKRAQADLESATEREKAAKAKGSDSSLAARNVKAAEENVKVVEAGVQERLNQSFFTPGFQYTMFVFLFVGFAIKVPVFPFHTWLPDAHVEAPTPISMILAGILLKLGGYGIIRIAYPVCPWAAEHLAAWVAIIGVVNIVYGAFTAMAQTDFKKLVAYSSISHMGYVILGIAVWSAGPQSQYWSWGMNGAMYQMIAHGITSAGMFFLVGVIYDRAHHRNLDNFRGLYEPMPLYGGISAIIFFAAMGLPGMCGFVGEFMVVLSAWNFAPPGWPNLGIYLSVLAAMTVVLTAAYILWTLQRVFMGVNPVYKNYKDMDLREVACIVPLVILAVALGVLPAQLVLNWMEPSVTGLIDTFASMKP
jgi:NADH-quinone oxidoreductase subunit M